MNTKAMLCCLVLLLPLVLLFAVDSSVSTASMTIEAFKKVSTVTTGTFEVTASFYESDTVTTPISGIGQLFDVSTRASNGTLADLSRVFVVNIKSNYGDKVKFSFRFGPFINQVENSKKLKATYHVSTEAQDWEDVRVDEYTTYGFRFLFSSDVTSVVNDGAVMASKECSIEGGLKSLDGLYEPFTIQPGPISQLNTYLEANIYGSLKVEASDYASIDPNVDYVSTIVITMEVTT